MHSLVLFLALVQLTFARFTLRAIPISNISTPVRYDTLTYANSTAFIGNIKLTIYSEPLLLTTAPSPGSMSPADDALTTFTSIHADPTSSRNFFIYLNESRPIGFTQAGSQFIPVGSAMTGFKDTPDGFWGWRDEERWWVCPLLEEELTAGGSTGGYDNKGNGTGLSEELKGSWRVLWGGAGGRGFRRDGTLREDCQRVRLRREEFC